MAASTRVIDDGTRCSQHYIGLHSVRQYLTIVGRRHKYRLLCLYMASFVGLHKGPEKGFGLQPRLFPPLVQKVPFEETL